jgi:hypothetical protein
MKLDPETFKRMKEHLAITLTHTVAKLGPMPDDCGALIKDLLKNSQDEIAIICIGIALEQAMEAGNYDSLYSSLEKLTAKC